MTMPETSSATSPRTPVWKLALIPILATILIWTLSSSADEPLDSVAAAETTADPNSADLLGSPPAQREFRNSGPASRPWPAVDHRTIAEFDPFTLTGELEQRSTLPPAAQEPHEVAALAEDHNEQQITKALSEVQLQGIFNGQQGPVALVDSRMVRIGDEIKPGLRVVEITSDGIVVEPVAGL